MILRALILVGLLVLPARASAQDRLLVGTQLTALNAALFVALSKGYFRDEGIEVEVRSFSGSQQVLNALAAGQLDLGTSDLTAAAFNIAGKGAIRAIASQARENKDYEGNQVVASMKAYSRGLHRMEDLSGRTIAITQIGSPFHYQLGVVAQAKNLDLAKVTLKQLQTAEAVSEEINNDRADAAILPVHYARALLMASQARLIGWCSEIDQPQLGALFASAKAVDAKHAAIEKFVRAYRRAAAEFTSAMFRRDRFAKRVVDKRSREISAIVGRIVYPKLPAERAMIAIETTTYYIDPQVRLDAADIARQIAWFKSQGLVDAGVDPGAVIDARFLGPAK